MAKPIDPIEELKEKVAKLPKSSLFVPLAEEYRKRGQLDEAISVLTAGIARQPGYVTARVSLGKIYLEMGKGDEALAEFLKVVKAIPDNLFSHKKLAELYRDKGMVDKARAEFSIVLDLNPMDEEAATDLAMLQFSEPAPAAAEAAPAAPEAPPESEDFEKTTIMRPQFLAHEGEHAASNVDDFFTKQVESTYSGTSENDFFASAEKSAAGDDEAVLESQMHAAFAHEVESSEPAPAPEPLDAQIGGMEFVPDGVVEEETEYRDGAGIPIGEDETAPAEAEEEPARIDAAGKPEELSEIDEFGVGAIELEAAEPDAIGAAQTYGEEEVLAAAVEEAEPANAAEPVAKHIEEEHPLPEEPVPYAPEPAPRQPEPSLHAVAATPSAAKPDEGLREAVERADVLIAQGEYVKAMNLYSALLADEPGNRIALMKVDELKMLLNMLGMGDLIYTYRLQSFMNAIKRRRDEFFANS